MNRNRSSEKSGCKIILILLIALAALSNAMKDLNRLQELTSSLQEVTSEWLGDGLITVNANKKGHRSDPSVVKIQVVEHPDGVTICAIYPSDDPEHY
jgi:hypothetical protein